MFPKKRVSGKTIYLNSLLCNNIIIEKIEIQFFFWKCNRDTYLSLICMRYRTTLRSHFLHSFTIKPLISDTQNPEISGFSTAHLYKYKTKRQAKMKRRQEKKIYFRWFLWILKSIALRILYCYTYKGFLALKKKMLKESLIDKFTFFVNILLKFSRRK